MNDRQKLLVVNEALKWIKRLDRIQHHIAETDVRMASAARCHMGKPFPDSIGFLQGLVTLEYFEDRMLEQYLIPIILRQIDDHIRVLKSEWSGELAVKGKQFRKMFRDSEVRELRNTLEHSADYLVGKGRTPSLMLKNEPDPSIRTDSDSREVVSVTLFGRQYVVKDLMSAALDLVGPLNDYKTALLE